MGYYTTGPDYLSGIQGLLPEEDPAQIAQPVTPVTPGNPGNPVSPLPGPGFTLPFEPPLPVPKPGGGGNRPGSGGDNIGAGAVEANQRYSYETYKGNTYKVDNVTGEAVEANMPFGTAGILGSVVGSIPGFENYRFSNDLNLNTQENLIAADRRTNPYRLSYPSTPYSKNKNDFNGHTKSFLDKDSRNIFNDSSDLDTDFGTDELRNIFSPNEKLNFDSENSFDGLLNRIRKEDEEEAKKSKLDDLDLNSKDSKDYAKKVKQAKALQDQQNARDLQKQQEKDRQAKLQKDADAAAVGREARIKEERERTNREGRTDKKTGLNKNRERQKDRNAKQSGKSRGYQGGR